VRITVILQAFARFDLDLAGSAWSLVARVPQGIESRGSPR
jgi:hypothetical protein